MKRTLNGNGDGSGSVALLLRKRSERGYLKSLLLRSGFEDNDTMPSLISIARAIRGHPAVRDADWLWDAVRKPYHALLNLTGGAKLIVGGVKIKIPAEHSGNSWNEVERKSIAAYTSWLLNNPGSLVLDIGSAFGCYSLVALFADSTVNVIAFESDLASIVNARRFCRLAPDIGRVSFVHGLVGKDQPTAGSIKVAIVDTCKKLAEFDGLDQPKFVCLGDSNTDAIPHYRLDDLFADDTPRRPILIKCDVEGAEQLVLLGARQFIARTRPTILLSVHPFMINRFGHTKEGIETLLTTMGYDVTLLESDHELHWLCQPR
jgi:FkbM family methyltransferase